ncbi:hypothetical protein ACHWQZ_G018319 [Mnemiopsis leidyi]
MKFGTFQICLILSGLRPSANFGLIDNLDIKDDTEKLLVPSFSKMSTSQYFPPSAAYDNDRLTFVHSTDATTSQLQWLDLHFDRTARVFEVVVELQRWDPWCQGSPESCGDSLTRLGGLQISVGSGDPESLQKCGEVIPEYPAPLIDPEFGPEVVVRSVTCSGEVLGDRVRFLQTREGVVLMISEVKVLGAYLEHDLANLEWLNINQLL